MYFKMKDGVGSHSEKDSKTGLPVVYKSGDIVKSDSDLAIRFPDKFERVNMGGLKETKSATVQDIETPEEEKSEVQQAAEEGVKDIQPPKKDEEEEQPPKKDEEEKKVKLRKKLGKDATAKFPRAEEEDFKVFYKKGKGYFVTESDEPFTALNKKPLKKAQVENFVEDYLE